VLVTSVAVAGCVCKPDVPVGEAAENFRKLAFACVQFAAANKGVGPSNQDALGSILAKQKGVAREMQKLILFRRDNRHP
jgi:hypothetical protein